MMISNLNVPPVAPLEDKEDELFEECSEEEDPEADPCS